MKIKIRRADKLFSDYIRSRDGWKCQADGKDFSNNKQGLHCSHYWGRARENTRFDPENCISLCFYHHQRWGHGDSRDDYTEYMVRKLGEQGFKKLKIRAHLFRKKDDTAIILWLKSLTNANVKNSKHNK